MREKYIIKNISELNDKAMDFAIIAGDFNCSDCSDVNRYMLGECTLNQMEANLYFYDLTKSYAARMNLKLEYILMNFQF